MDNALYDGRQGDNPVSAAAMKKETIDWLGRHGVQCDTLYTITNSAKPKLKNFRVDWLLENYCHSAVRMPPHMCQQRPTELAWAKLKRHV
jgi:hypothetical protein